MAYKEKSRKKIAGTFSGKNWVSKLPCQEKRKKTRRDVSRIQPKCNIPNHLIMNAIC